MQLTYTVQLTNPKTQAGTYGAYDADGSQGYAGLYTNNSAVLTPVDSTGAQGAAYGIVHRRRAGRAQPLARTDGSAVRAGGLGSTHAHTCQPADRRQQHPRHMGRLTELGRHRRRINGLPGLSQTQIRITARAFCRYAVYFGRVHQKKETFLQGLLLLIVCQRPAAQRIAR